MIQWKAFNQITRKMEIVNIEEMELAEGIRLIKMFYYASAQQFVCVPGASLFIVDANLRIVPCED